VDSVDFSGPRVDAVESVLGMTIPEFVSSPLRLKFDAIGIGLSPGWVTVATEINAELPRFEVTVSSDDPVSGEDDREIRSRFDDPSGMRKAVLEKRKPWEDEDGIFRMPSFTGGGGMGLLECIRLSNEHGLKLEYVPLEHEKGLLPCFRLSCPCTLPEDDR
jgi:hypothetical protein